MGCAPTKPLSARSWEADKEKRSAKGTRSPPRSDSSKVRVLDTGATRGRFDEEPAERDEPETRQLGDGRLGVSDDEQIDKLLAQVDSGSLFVDRDFPITSNAILAQNDRANRNIRWKRPRELNKKARLLVDGVSRGDIAQGNLGDCWFLSACAAIAQKPQLMTKLIPDGQKLAGRSHQGLVRFRFWRFGQWVSAYVDDYLPVDDASTPIYARNVDPSEFWVSLIEKAYAKVHGSYCAIEGGQAMDALVDLTGGLAERYELDSSAADLYPKLATAVAAGAFVTCSRKGDWRAEHTRADATGLIAGHAYTVTDVKRIKRVHGTENLIRVRNPWGMGDEWNGAWADKDHRWDLVDDDTKKWLQYVNKEDGEFWMAYKDFTKQFQEVTICTVGPDFDGDGQADAAGTIRMLHGAWRVGGSAGGCRNDIHAFARNPQYLLTVHEPDEGDGATLTDEQPKETCSVVIGLMQEHRRSRRHEGVRLLQIGFILYATDDDQRLPVEHFQYNYETAKSGTYVNLREICGRFELRPGRYVLVASTYAKDEDGTFLLRVYAAKSVELRALPSYEDTIMPPTVASAQPTQRVYDLPDYDDDVDAEIEAAMRADR